MLSFLVLKVVCKVERERERVVAVRHSLHRPDKYVRRPTEREREREREEREPEGERG